MVTSLGPSDFTMVISVLNVFADCIAAGAALGGDSLRFTVNETTVRATTIQRKTGKNLGPNLSQSL